MRRLFKNKEYTVIIRKGRSYIAIEGIEAKTSRGAIAPAFKRIGHHFENWKVHAIILK